MNKVLEKLKGIKNRKACFKTVIALIIEGKEYSRGFFLHGLSVNLAEALAAYMHDRIRDELKVKKDQGKRFTKSNSDDGIQTFNGSSENLEETERVYIDSPGSGR